MPLLGFRWGKCGMGKRLENNLGYGLRHDLGVRWVGTFDVALLRRFLHVDMECRIGRRIKNISPFHHRVT